MESAECQLLLDDDEDDDEDDDDDDDEDVVRDRGEESGMLAAAVLPAKNHDGGDWDVESLVWSGLRSENETRLTRLTRQGPARTFTYAYAALTHGRLPRHR
ncbi:hypothetical protein E4U43_008222 [Claviceps pusilla]|uniref:Uncharacterized protein n=1 Tax=Claviceps pusilla TaxID=123648 RepID=A0A9P7NB22_9HYPO|nr:hypothetical protein E4U43_008222 [Claviceps pusilla]